MDISVAKSPIPGLVVVKLPVHEDPRGWFKENWQREKMVAAGLPDFRPVQNNISFNDQRGVTRGLHAEPWDKFVSVASGKVFANWIDLRSGDTFGVKFSIEITPDVAVFVPKGVANGYQVLEANTAYSYLVTKHWHPEVRYTAVNVNECSWPIPLTEAEVVLSEKDQANPKLAEVSPIPAPNTLIIGHGQVGKALLKYFPTADVVERTELDLTDLAQIQKFNFENYDFVINSAGYTAVDFAETAAGRSQAWATNATGVGELTRQAITHGFTLVHYSTDYVFDGSKAEYHEADTFAPLSVYGQSKACGDLLVSQLSNHYLIRTSWVVGDGNNFVKTMQRLATTGVSPDVVSDQIGRLSFADEIARATHHLITAKAEYGCYNVSNSGPILSWAEYAKEIFKTCGIDPAKVNPVTTQEYAAGKQIAPRPANSSLNLAKLIKTGFVSKPAQTALAEYLAELS